MAAGEHQAPDIGLGECNHVFKPMMATILTGFVFSILLVLGGAAAIGFPLRAAYLADWNLPVEVKKGWSWLAVGLFCLIGIGLLIGGVALAAYSRGLMSRCVQICANGFRFCSRRSTEDVLWAEITRIQEIILYQRPPVLKGPAKLLLPKVASTSYKIVTTSGKEYAFDGDSIKGIKRFGKVLREQADRLSLRWESVEQHG